MTATATAVQVLEPAQDDLAGYRDVIETGAAVVLVMRRWDLERPADSGDGARWAGPMDAVAAYVGGERIWEEHSAGVRWTDAMVDRMVKRARQRLAKLEAGR